MPDPAEPITLPWLPTDPPYLPPEEVGPALTRGSLPGVVDAIIARIDPTPDAATQTIIRSVCRSAGADGVVRKFVGGHPTPHAAVLQNISPYVLAATVLRDALISVGYWIDANPGQLVGTDADQRRIWPTQDT